MIIGLTGKKQAGKDTVADYLVEHYGYTKVGFSDVMYEAVCALWGIDLEQALDYKTSNIVTTIQELNSLTDHNDFRHNLGSYTWREHLQRFGTEMGRNVFGEDFWVDQFSQKYLRHGADNNYVVRDVRYNNEAKMISAWQGDIWMIHRPELPDDDTHETEAGIDENFIRGDLLNDGTIEQLYEMLAEWMMVAYDRYPIPSS